MKKLILAALSSSIIFTILSTIIIRVDLSYYDSENDIVYDLKDEFFMLVNKSDNKNSCDIICPQNRGFPFIMSEWPQEHGENLVEKGIFYNLLFYFLIAIFSIGLFKIYTKK